MCAKKEEIVENDEIAKLKIEIEALKKENSELWNIRRGNESLIVQVADLFQKADDCITSIKYNLIDGDKERPVLAGAKIMELYGLIDNNNRILKEITQRIQNQEYKG